MQAGILIYALYGAKAAEGHIKQFESIIKSTDGVAFRLCQPDHSGTMLLYFDDTEKALAALSKCVYRFLQVLFNSEAISEEVAEYAEISLEQCHEHMKADEHPSFAWSIAIGGKLYGSQIYLV